ncbi:MAG: hypothetical protein WCW66_02775 [Patescibacteria group bacterium]
MANSTQPNKNTKDIKNESIPITMKVLQILLGVNAVIWLVFGIIASFGGTTKPDYTNLMEFISLFMFVDAGLLIFIMIGTIKKQSWTYTGGLIILVVNIVLSITDEFGPADFIALFAGLAALILLLTNKPVFDSFKKK